MITDCMINISVSRGIVGQSRLLLVMYATRPPQTF
jgi:hypothetical protein